ncbi:MAG: AMP-binding protein [Thiotrichales bacterium]|nr:AMP-binding protein [Thiotrichales bacterium]
MLSRLSHHTLRDAWLLTDGTDGYSTSAIISAAWHLAQHLPAKPHVVNLFSDRHAFLVVLLAVAMRSGTLLLPSSTTSRALDDIQAFFPDRLLWLASDCSILNRPGAEWISSEDIRDSLAEEPSASLEQMLAAFDFNSDVVMFTSGSTGLPKPVRKTWRELAVMGENAIARFGWADVKPYVVATVPQQHMFGFETTMLWPLLSGAQVYSGRPLFPEDIQAAINGVDGREVWLISTPLHLRKLLDYGVEFTVPRLNILSATAPLSAELARDLSTHFNARVFEVYGSTETASLASRELLRNPLWRLYDGYRLSQQADSTNLHIEALEQTHTLHDRLRLVDGEHFELMGRQSDLVKVAGKRASLADLNRALLGIDGVEDATFWYDEGSDRMQALVVSATLDAARIRSALTPWMDPVFLPRRIHFVDSLPRNTVGKLPQAALAELVASLQEK